MKDYFLLVLTIKITDQLLTPNFDTFWYKNTILYTDFISFKNICDCFVFYSSTELLHYFTDVRILPCRSIPFRQLSFSLIHLFTLSKLFIYDTATILRHRLSDECVLTADYFSICGWGRNFLGSFEKEFAPEAIYPVWSYCESRKLFSGIPRLVNNFDI